MGSGTRRAIRIGIAVLVAAIAVWIVLPIFNVEIPRHTDLGTIDASRAGSVLESSIVVPGLSIGVSLVIEDGKGGAVGLCPHPDWPLVLRIEAIDDAGRTVAASRIDRGSMVFTNWHEPSTSVWLEIGFLRGRMDFGRRYRLRAEVEQAARFAAPTRIFLDWMDTPLYRLRRSWRGGDEFPATDR